MPLMPQFWLLDGNCWSLFFLTDYKILINMKEALLTFSVLSFNTVDGHFGISLQHEYSMLVQFVYLLFDDAIEWRENQHTCLSI